MSLPSIIVVFFINWLIVFFIILPIGIKVPEKQILGHAKSAPKKTYLLFKLFMSLLISSITTTCVIFLIQSKFF